MIKLTFILLFSVTSLCFSSEKALDFWDEEIRLFGTAGQDQHIDQGLQERRSYNYHPPKGIGLDHADHVEGDLSIVYLPAEVGMPSRFGFVASLWDEKWHLSEQMTLRLWLKTNEEQPSAAWKIYLVDAAGKEATGTLAGISTQWKELRLPLSELSVAKGFDWQQVKLCEFEAVVSKETRIHLDGVRFEGADIMIGVTDKSIAQRMAEAKRTRAFRIRDAFKRASDENSQQQPIVSAFAKFMLNEDLETANRMLIEDLKGSSMANVWHLLKNLIYCRFYYMFSNRYGKYPGRMSAEAEKLLLETLWERTKEANDIHWSRQSTWWLDGSENHDLDVKSVNLVSSRIFMNEPQYKERLYPDYGFGGSYHYGHAGYYGPGIDPETRHGGGRANLSDGKTYNAADHYAAWRAYFKTYIRERARRGFFVEQASPTYTKHSLGMLKLVAQFSGDKELHELADNFFTLYWAAWAQVSVSGVRGGPKTRHHKDVGGFMQDKGTSDLISFHLGGPANAGPWWYWNLIDDYQLPAIIWKMVLDREGMGNYVFKSRGIGEENNEMPRPLGTERSLVVDTDSRFLKYTYVTPDYTLGTQKDHPLAFHSHLSIAGRWHGMTFSQNPECRIVPVGVTDGITARGQKRSYDMVGMMYRSVQLERTLIIQQSPRWSVIHPEWFPAKKHYDKPTGIWLGNDWDQRMEKDGWIFVRSGIAYAAVRPVLWDEAWEKEHKKKTTGNQVFFNAYDDKPTVKLSTDRYCWSDDQSMLIYDDNHTPTIIEAGSKSDYPTLEAFMADVMDNPIALYKTVVPGYNILVYTGCGVDAKEIVFNAGSVEIPTVGNEPIDYSYPMTFDSPYLKSVYKSGVIKIIYEDQQLNLNFNK